MGRENLRYDRHVTPNRRIATREGEASRWISTRGPRLGHRPTNPTTPTRRSHGMPASRRCDPASWTSCATTSASAGGRDRAGLVRGDRAGGARPGGASLAGQHQPRLPAEGQAGLLSVARIPDRPAAGRRAEQSRPDRMPCARRWRALGVDLDAAARRWSRTRHSAMAGSAGWPRASWKAWRRSASPPTATASATTTACSGRSSRTAGSRNPGGLAVASATRGSSSGRRSRYDIGFGGTVEAVRDGADGTHALCLAPGRDDRRRWPTTRRSSAGAAACEHAAAVVGARRRPAAARCVQPRRPCGRAAPTGCGRRRSRKVLYPSDDDARRAGTAAAAGVFLRLRLAAGPGAPAHRRGYRRPRHAADKVAIQLNDTHPAIAVAELMRHPASTCTACRGTRPGASRTATQLHQPHPAARGAGDLAGAADGAAAAAPHADHLPDQRAATSTRVRRSASRRRPAAVARLADRRGAGRRVRMGHLAFLGSHGVNGVSALHTDLMRETVFQRPARALSRTASSTRPTASPSAAGCTRPIPG